MREKQLFYNTPRLVLECIYSPNVRYEILQSLWDPRGGEVTEKANRRYKSPPLNEALIQFNTRPSSDASLNSLEFLRKSIQAEYPDVESMEQQIATFTPTGPEASGPKRIGFRYFSRDKKSILQAQLESFTVSRLRPYSHWEELVDETRRLWKEYQNAVAPDAITQVIVRYINILELPQPVRDFRDYLRTYPEVSSDMPIELSSYFMQIQVPFPFPNNKASATVIQGFAQTDKPDIVPIFLDIEVNSGDLAKEQDPWPVLENLRILKNEVFEACITNKTRELFN